MTCEGRRELAAEDACEEMRARCCRGDAGTELRSGGIMDGAEFGGAGGTRCEQLIGK